MNPSNASIVDQLHQEFNTKTKAAHDYKRANLIFGLEDADTTYLQLLIERNKAELEYREAAGEKNHIPRIKHQLQRYKDLLQSLTGVIV